MVSFRYVLVVLIFFYTISLLLNFTRYLFSENFSRYLFTIFLLMRNITRWMLDTEVKVFHESISYFMKWPWNCISWNTLKEKFHSVSFPLGLFHFGVVFTWISSEMKFHFCQNNCNEIKPRNKLPTVTGDLPDTMCRYRNENMSFRSKSNLT